MKPPKTKRTYNRRRDFYPDVAKTTLRDAGFGRNRMTMHLSEGEFSLIDWLDAALDHVKAENAEVVFSLWTAAKADIEKVHEWREQGRVGSVRWIFDRSFNSRFPHLQKLVRDRFGKDAVRTLSVHAKFVLVQMNDWNLLINTSANLNLNKRIEFFTLEDDAETFSGWRNFVDSVFSEKWCMLEGRDLNRAIYQSSIGQRDLPAMADLDLS